MTAASRREGVYTALTRCEWRRRRPSMRSGCSARSRTGVLGDFESVTVGVDPLEPDVRAKRLDDAELQGTLDAILAAGWCRWTSVASRSSTTAPANSDETFS